MHKASVHCIIDTVVVMRQGDSIASGLFDLPPEIFSNVLASFCDGKAISTFLLASQASRGFDGFDTVQGALVERYQELSRKVKDPDIAETLEILINQIRSCERTSPEAMKLFSERCAILDYFEPQILFDRHWLIWCGEFESFYGNVQAYITSPYWSISAISSWYRDLELSQFSMVRPRVPIDRPEGYPFGCIAGRGRRDILLIENLRVNLDANYDAAEYWKGMMTAIQFAYDHNPSLVITTHAYPTLAEQEQVHIPNWLPKTKSLCCYWDDFDGYDDEALHNLGEHIVRLMQRFSATNTGSESASTPSFRECWRMTVADHQAPPVNYFEEGDTDDDEEEELVS
jgi:hypothetical protein